MKTNDFLRQKTGNYNSYNHQRNQELILHYHELNEEEQNEVLLLNIGLVYKIASKFNNQNVYPSDFQEELVSIGLIGLKRALETYDAKRKYMFSTYAANCIRNKIILYLKKYNKYVNKEFSMDKLLDVEDERNDFKLSDVFISSDLSPHEKVQEEEYQFLLSQWIKELSLEDQFMLEKLYGLGEVEKKTKTALAQELGVSQVCVYQRQKKIIKKLRRHFINEGMM